MTWPRSRPLEASRAAASSARARVVRADRVERAEQQVRVGDAEHGEHVLGRDLAPGVRDELLERAERVAERAGRVPGQQRDARRGRSSISSSLGDPRDHGGELLDRRPAEVEAVAAVDDRRQDLLRLGRREHEDRVRRRLLEGLEERVPRLRREHVRLVEDVDLVAAGDRRVGDALAQVADVVDGVVRRRVHLDDVERRRAGDRHARVALRRTARSSGPARSSGRRRGSSPSTSCPCRASRRRGRRGGPCPARRRCAGCARRAPVPPRRRRCAGGGDGRARGRRTRTIECSGRKGSSRIGRLGVMEGRR